MLSQHWVNLGSLSSTFDQHEPEIVTYLVWRAVNGEKVLTQRNDTVFSHAYIMYIVEQSLVKLS